jgi:aryl-alcohol dehydrogenase-like predicted oxidoreductase
MVPRTGGSDVEYRNVGRSGLRVSVAGVGCNNFGMRIDATRAREVVHAALDEGITAFDTAPMYGNGQSEEMLGQALGSRRGEVVIIDKFGVSTGPSDAGGSRAHITAAIDKSLKLLGTDYIDLYLQHFPDNTTAIDETLSALDDLTTTGKIRYSGSSNFTGWMVANADWVARTRGLRGFIAAENDWSLLSRGVEVDIVPACEHFGIGVLPFFPLASGLLTGKVRRGEAAPEGSRLASKYFSRGLTDTNFDKVERLEKYAAEHGTSLHELALSFLASQPSVPTVVAGATSAEQVVQNAEYTRTDLTKEQLAEITALV